MNLSVCLSTKLKDCLIVKAVKASINLSNVSYKSCTLLWYAKKEKYLHKISMFTFTNVFFPGLLNLGAKIRYTAGPKIPPAITLYIKTFYSLWFIRLRLTNHGSSTFCLFTHPLFFVFLIINKNYLNRWKQNSRDISNCNIWTKFVFYKY